MTDGLRWLQASLKKTETKIKQERFLYFLNVKSLTCIIFSVAERALKVSLKHCPPF